MADKYNLYTRDDLVKLGIYDLRELGREIGVPSPTTLKKDELVDYIVGIIYGTAEKKSDGMLRGRPARNKQKPYQKFVDLIDKIESPVLSTSIINSDGEDYENSFYYRDFLSSKVASPSVPFTNDADQSDCLTLQKGVVCETEGAFYLRKLRYFGKINDVPLSDSLVFDYNLKPDDIVDYLPGKDGEVAQIIKVNNQFVSRTSLAATRLKNQGDTKQVDVNKRLQIDSRTSNVVYATDQVEREKLMEDIIMAFEMEDYNIVKVCFDRKSPVSGEIKSSKRSEYYAECVGDEYETVSMCEMALNRARFYAVLGYETLLIIDNLPWLMHVLKTYPESVYGTFISQLAKLPKNANVTVVCLASHLANDKVEELSEMFDNILNPF